MTQTRHPSEIKTIIKLVFLIVSCVTLNSLINMGFMLVFGTQLGFNLLYNHLTYCLSTIGGISLQCPSNEELGKGGGNSLWRREGSWEPDPKKVCKRKPVRERGPLTVNLLTWRNSRAGGHPDHSSGNSSWEENPRPCPSG